MKVKKILAALLAASLLLVTTACNGGNGNSSTGSKGGETSSQSSQTSSAADSSTPEEGNTAASDGDYGGLVPMADADDPITFSYFVRDPGMAPADDNPVINKITELTGVTLEFEHLVGDLDQKIGVMIAGGEYPDLIFTGSAPKFMEAEAVIPLENYLPNYPNLWKWYGQSIKYLKQADGHIYALPLYDYQDNDITTTSPVFECGYGFYIQKAVLEEAGYPQIHTLDEYFDLIEDYVEKHPTIDGVKTIGYDMLVDGWQNWSLLNPPMNLMGDGNEGNIFVDHETHETSFYQTSDTAHDFYKKLNEEYHKGIIRAEALTQNADEYTANITTGAVLGFFDQNWHFDGARNVLLNDGKNERTYVALPIANPGVQDAYIDAANGIPSANNGVMISKDCKDPERVLAFFDWLLQREVQDYLQWGEEGVDWNWTEDKTDKVLTPERRAINRDTDRSRDLTGSMLVNYTPYLLGTYKEDGVPVNPGCSPAEYLASQNEFDQEFLKNYDIQFPAELMSEPVKHMAYYPVWSMSLEDGSPAAIAQTKFLDVCTKYYPQMILAEDDAQFESLWEQFVNDFNACNIDAYKSEIDRQIAEKIETQLSAE